MDETEKALFAVYAEIDGFERPLIQTGLTFARLIDDVVYPYEDDKPFFIDGVSVTKKKVRRLKILRQRDAFRTAFFDLHHGMRRGDVKVKKILGDQYYVRLEAALREGCEDVTSQIIKAFDVKIRPRLKDYLPDRNELIESAAIVFWEGLKKLGGL